VGIPRVYAAQPAGTAKGKCSLLWGVCEGFLALCLSVRPVANASRTFSKCCIPDWTESVRADAVHRGLQVARIAETAEHVSAVNILCRDHFS
jgi:hypothetical protein